MWFPLVNLTPVLAADITFGLMCIVYREEYVSSLIEL